MSDVPMSRYEREALRLIAHDQERRINRLWWWNAATMPKLAARGYAEPHPEWTHLKHPPYIITEAGKVAAKALKA